MRHLKETKKLGRDRAQRKALKILLASSLVMKKKIKTTEAKAKFVQPYIEKIITVSKKKTLDSKRVIQELLSKKAAKILIKEVKGITSAKKSGYTRIVKIPARKGDNARMALLEIIL